MTKIFTAAPSLFISAIVAFGISGCGTLTNQRPASPLSDANFCARAQAAIVATNIPSTTEVFAELDPFVKSKPAIRPLALRQYVDRVDGQPRLVSCKMKTADHLVAEYGTQAAGTDIGCDGVNRRNYESVLASFSTSERRQLRFDQGRKVAFDADWMTPFGPDWLAAFPFVQVDEAGVLHVQSKAMRNEWGDARYFDAPVAVRGTRYCRLVAPEYLRRLLQGLDTLP